MTIFFLSSPLTHFLGLHRNNSRLYSINLFCDISGFTTEDIVNHLHPSVAIISAHPCHQFSCQRNIVLYLLGTSEAYYKERSCEFTYIKNKDGELLKPSLQTIHYF